MALVQTTLFQNPIEVPDDEVPILKAQGLLGDATSPVTDVPDQTAGDASKDDEAEKPSAKETKE